MRMTSRRLVLVTIFCVLALLPTKAFAEEEVETKAPDQSTEQVIDEAKETTNEAIEAAKRAILDAIDRAKELTSSTLEAERDAAERALDDAKEATKTLDHASEAAREVLEEAKKATVEVLDSVEEAIQPFSELVEGRSVALQSDGQLSKADIENLVERSYQYVAMYNVNNKFAAKQGGCLPELFDRSAERSGDP
jgi:ABC-type transporter Mla subunit MlaD